MLIVDLERKLQDLLDTVLEESEREIASRQKLWLSAKGKKNDICMLQIEDRNIK